MSFTSYGVRVGVRTTDPEALTLVHEVLPPEWRPLETRTVPHLYSLVAGGAGTGRGVRRMWVLYDGWVRIARGREPEPILEALESAIRLKVAEESPQRVFVHAGAVGWKGKAILVPGRTFTGKSTLIGELVKAGATYYSDEFGILDARGRVYPFPTGISIRDEDARGARLDPSAFGGRQGVKPLPLGLVVVSEFAEGSRWRPRKLSAAEGALELLANTVSARKRPDVAMAAFRAALSDAVVLRGKRGEAAEVASAILEEVARG